MTAEKLTFVSVVFEAEFLLLSLQARAMARYLSADLVEEIVVIDNSAKGIPRATERLLCKEYGDLWSIVRIVRPDQISDVPGTTGWRSQQVLKLCIAEQLRTRLYVVLDAKNVAVGPLDLAHFVAPDGRARVNSYGYQTHPLRPALEQVLRYLGVDPEPHIARFSATVTPFVLETALVRAMIRDVEATGGRSFAREFVAHELTEFFLYSGWLIREGKSLDEVYDFHQVSWPNVWPRSAGLVKVQEAIQLADERRPPLFSVHRKALGNLDDASIGALARFWTERDLFDDEAAALAFIADFRTVFAREERVRRLRELPYQMAKLANRGVAKAARRPVRNP